MRSNGSLWWLAIIHSEREVAGLARLTNLRWYFRTYDDQSIRSVDLRKALAAAHDGIKFIKMSGRQPVNDVSIESVRR